MSKVIRLREDLVEKLNSISLDINEAIDILLINKPISVREADQDLGANKDRIVSEANYTRVMDLGYSEDFNDGLKILLLSERNFLSDKAQLIIKAFIQEELDRLKRGQF